MWMRDGNVWRWDTVPELEVRPRCFPGGMAVWEVWFCGAPYYRMLKPSRSSEDVRQRAYEYFCRWIDL